MLRLALAAILFAAAVPASAQRVPVNKRAVRLQRPVPAAPMPVVAPPAAAAKASVLDPSLQALAAEVGLGKTSQAAAAAARQRADVDASGRLGVFIDLVPGASAASLAPLGAEVTAAYGSLLTVRLPFEALPALGEHPAVARASAIRRTARRHLLNSRAEIRADLVHAGHGLGRAVTGARAVVGAVDSGVDLGHPDFWTSAGASRFLAVKDDYRSLSFTRAQIEGSGRAAAATAMADTFAHGTHVIGTVGGSGVAQASMKGIAPDADLVMVRSNYSDDSIVNGCAFVFQQAKAVNKPAVCNLSLGSHAGPHDGTSAFETRLSALVEPGYFVVASSGNEGNDYIHAGQAMTPTREARALYVTNFFSYTSSVEGWFDRGAVTQIQVIAYYVENGSLVVGARTPVYTLGQTPTRVPIGTGGQYGFFTMDAFSASGDDGMFRLYLDSDEALNVWVGDYYYEIAVRGTSAGRVDMWDQAYDAPGYFHSETLGGTGHDEILGGRSHSTGEPATGLKVMSVGAYANTLSWTDFNGASQTWEGFYGNAPQRGQLSDFSSRGPSRDGRRLPLIVAPGEVVFAPFARLAWQEGQADSASVDRTGRYLGVAGTSMSAPHVSAVLALMLDVNPRLSYEQAVGILQTSARRDGFTGALPSDSAGFGKVDALAAVQAAAALASSAEDDARATGLGLDVPTPNPVRTRTTVRFASASRGPARLALYDVLGREVAVLFDGAAAPGVNEATVDAAGLAPGAYLVRLTTGAHTRTQRLVVVR